MDRRNFLSWVGVGLLASSLPVAIAACTSDSGQKTEEPKAETEPASKPPAREDGFVEVGSLQDLKSQTFIADKDFATGPLLVIQDPQDSAKLIALNSTCPHKQCNVEWKQDKSSVTCPCHGSEFKYDGALVKGPADKPLGKFEVKTEGDKVLVKAA